MKVLLLVRSSYWQVLYQSYCWCYSRASIEKVSGPSVKSDRYPNLCGFTHIHVGSRLVSRRIEFGKSWKTTQCHLVSSDVDVSMELHQSDNSLWITTWSGNDWVFCPHHHHHRHNDDSYWFTVITIINIIIIIVIIIIMIWWKAEHICQDETKNGRVALWYAASEGHNAVAFFCN